MNKEIVCIVDCLRQAKSKFMVKGKTITSFFYFQKCLSLCKEEENKKRGKEENLGVCFWVLFDCYCKDLISGSEPVHYVSTKIWYFSNIS